MADLGLILVTTRQATSLTVTGNEAHRYGFPIDYENAAKAAKDNTATVAEEAA